MPGPLRLDAATVGDRNGLLRAVDLSSLPFVAERVFTVTGVPAGTRRGGHAHRVCAQALFCVGGVVDVEVITTTQSCVYRLLPSEPGLYLPPLHWASQSYITPDSALLVVASHPYDPDDYIAEAPTPVSLRTDI